MLTAGILFYLLIVYDKKFLDGDEKISSATYHFLVSVILIILSIFYFITIEKIFVHFGRQLALAYFIFDLYRYTDISDSFAKFHHIVIVLLILCVEYRRETSYEISIDVQACLFLTEISTVFLTSKKLSQNNLLFSNEHYRAKEILQNKRYFAITFIFTRCLVFPISTIIYAGEIRSGIVWIFLLSLHGANGIWAYEIWKKHRNAIVNSSEIV